MATDQNCASDRFHNQVSLDADHSRMAKFVSAEAEDCNTISRRNILEYVKEAPAVMAKRLRRRVAKMEENCKHPERSRSVLVVKRWNWMMPRTIIWLLRTGNRPADVFPRSPLCGAGIILGALRND